VSNWNPLQRAEFARALKENSSPQISEPSLEALLSNLNKMSIQSSEGPSVFECQLKIFSRYTTFYLQKNLY
jgi:hypothetical protein